MNNNLHELVNDFSDNLLELSNNIEDIDTMGELEDLSLHFDDMLDCVFADFARRWKEIKGDCEPEEEEEEEEED